MKTHIFISRALDPDSPLRQVESAAGVTLIHESLISIHPNPVDQLPVADWFFFYSKNGVECFAKQWEQKWKSNPKMKDIRWAAMGEGTAESLKGWGITSDFVGRGEAEEIATQFLEHSKPSESVVFFRASHSRNRLYQLISEHRDASHIVIYDNQLIEKEFPPVDIGIFTSGRNAIAFFENNTEPEQACIAIGQPTADTLLTLNVPEDKIYIAETPSEDALYDELKKVLKL
ncbi:uroporphyrinogen-III synthase [Membranicola marinus]|uniref:Uroporphyrinogen-III synthase n=1 Tax=Membranihabitans marinus TaxID=1227546 RepID=A0A953HY55_9BACT|nr:uroporphyrinogen-III synthase [Membranihabitans marinus]MBY5957872.1 uroporphyrinogen-III synthase [Membranihabitans marinus]